MSASPPPTPPPRAPTNDEWRFESITSPCEWIEDYRPGGYHPVHLGDVFHDGQYKIIRKLGDGAYSTVWLARDMRYVPAPLLDIKAIDYDRSFVPRNNRYVALKILVSELSGSARELQILEHLDAASPTESSQYVTQLLSTFELQGPNGTHKCLVFEPMGPSVNSMVEELPQFNPRRWEMKVRYQSRWPRVFSSRLYKPSHFFTRTASPTGTFSRETCSSRLTISMRNPKKCFNRRKTWTVDQFLRLYGGWTASKINGRQGTSALCNRWRPLRGTAKGSRSNCPT